MNEQWEDSLHSERYPFAGVGEIVADSGNVLPMDAILDLNLLVQVDVVTVLLASITVSASGAVYRFELEDGTLVGTLTSTTADTELMPVMLGTLTVGYARLDLIASAIVRGWPRRVHTMTEISLIPHLLVVSDTQWRRGFRLPDETILTGDVYLVAARGLWFERTVTGFRLHVTGDPFNERTEPARGLLTLNEGVPDAQGNVNLIGLGTTNFPTPVFVLDGQPFRINIQPGTTTLTLELVGEE